MKKYNILILTIFTFSFTVNDYSNWEQKADFGGGKVYDAASFVIGKFAYVATGCNAVGALYGNSKQRYIYRYDPSLDVWKRMADLPPAANAKFNAIGFAIEGKGYVCGGFDDATLWEYDPGKDLWYQRINFPRVIEEGIGFSILSKAYAGLGGANILDYRNDFYEYDPSKNKWKQLNDFPGAPRRGSIGFSMNGKGYAGLGYKDIGSYNKGYYNDLWEYDPSTDEWTRLPDFPGEARQDAIGFGINGVIYVGMGKINDFYKYDLKTKEWSTLNYISGGSRVHAFSFCIDSAIYYGGGMSPNLASDMWKYSPFGEYGVNISSLSKERINLYPNPATIYFNIEGINGSNAKFLVSDLNGRVYISSKVIKDEKISVNSLPKGAYLVTIITENGRFVRKLVKE